jgi:arginine/lysine/histidine transporter system substrate-binding protein
MQALQAILSDPLKRRLIASLLCLLLTGMFIYEWFAAQPYNDGTWARVQKNGVLRFGMDASYPPFSDTPDGKPSGLDVDIANEIGRRLGVRVEIVNMGFDGLYDSLKTGQVDALISALSIDPTKINDVIYTLNYIDAGQVIGSVSGQHTTMRDLDGKTVAVEHGSIGDEVVRVWQRRLHVLKAVRYTTSDEAMSAVHNGETDAVLVDSISARLYNRVNPGLQLSSDLVTHDPYSVVVRIASYDLAGAVSDAIRAMGEDGTLATILARWL